MNKKTYKQKKQKVSEVREPVASYGQSSGEQLSFDKILLLFKETDKKIQETDRILSEMSRKTDKKIQETDRILSEMSRKTDKKIQETDRILSEISQKTDKKLNKLENLFTGQWGKLVESLVEGDLVQLLKKRHINVEETYERLKRIYNGKEIEIDIIAANGSDVVPVEVKTTMKVEDVNIFLEKLKIFRKVFTKFENNKIIGAIAYIKVEEEADKYAYRQGLFVIRATGKSAVITNDEKFVPRVF